MKLHRIFIAINLPQETKQQLLSFKEKYPELPARWTTPENLHLTLVFYGSASDTELEKIKQKTKEIAKKYKPFTVKLSQITYGPNAREPRMIWAIGNISPELRALQKALGTLKLVDLVSNLETKSTSFTPHLTLAHLKEFEFKRMESEELPNANDAISLDFSVHSIEIMESKLKRSGAEYTICESISLV